MPWILNEHFFLFFNFNINQTSKYSTGSIATLLVWIVCKIYFLCTDNGDTLKYTAHFLCRWGGVLHRQLLFLLILFLWAADNNEIKPLTWIYIITYSSAPSFTLRDLEELRAHFIWIKVKIVYKLQLLSEITKMPPTMKRKCIFCARQDFNIY